MWLFHWNLVFITSVFCSYFVFYFMYLFMFIVNCYSLMYSANNCCYEHCKFSMSIKAHLIHTTCCCCGYCCCSFNVKPNRGYSVRSGAQPSNYTDCQHSQQVNNWFLKMSINYNFQMLIVFYVFSLVSLRENVHVTSYSVKDILLFFTK